MVPIPPPGRPPHHSSQTRSTVTQLHAPPGPSSGFNGHQQAGASARAEDTSVPTWHHPQGSRSLVSQPRHTTVPTRHLSRLQPVSSPLHFRALRTVGTLQHCTNRTLGGLQPSASIARRQPLLSAATRPHPLYPSRHADPLQDSSTTHTLNLNAPSGFNGHQQAGASARLEDTGGHTSGPIRHHLKAPASLVSPALPGSTHRRYLATLHQPDPGRSSAPCARHHLPCYAGDRFPVWLPPRQPHTLPTMQQTAPVRHLTPVCECGGRK